jgi:hypothetical protein
MAPYGVPAHDGAPARDNLVLALEGSLVVLKDVTVAWAAGVDVAPHAVKVMTCAFVFLGGEFILEEAARDDVLPERK